MDEPQVDPSLGDWCVQVVTGLGDCHRHDGLPGVAVLSILRFGHQDRGEWRRMDEPKVDPSLGEWFCNAHKKAPVIEPRL